MLRLIRETCSVLTLLHDDCTFAKTDVQSVIFEFKHPYKKRVELNSTTFPTASNFVDKDLTVLYNLNISTILPSSLNAVYKSEIYQLDYYIIKFSHYSGSISANSNLLNGTDILNDFQDTNYVYLGDSFYEIDKRKSTQNQLFLKKPVSTSFTTYNPAYLSKEFFGVFEQLKKEIRNKISKVTPCNNCDNKVSELCNDVIMLMSASNAVVCNDLEGAKTIFKHLNSKYESC